MYLELFKLVDCINEMHSKLNYIEIKICFARDSPIPSPSKQHLAHFSI